MEVPVYQPVLHFPSRSIHPPLHLPPVARIRPSSSVVCQSGENGWPGPPFACQGCFRRIGHRMNRGQGKHPLTAVIGIFTVVFEASANNRSTHVTRHGSFLLNSPLHKRIRIDVVSTYLCCSCSCRIPFRHRIAHLAGRSIICKFLQPPGTQLLLYQTGCVLNTLCQRQGLRRLSFLVHIGQHSQNQQTDDRDRMVCC